MVGKKGSVSLIEYKLLEKGTENFRDNNILGEGGFGRVYRAQLDDNLIVAVKKMDCQTQDAEREFQVLLFFKTFTFKFIFCVLMWYFHFGKLQNEVDLLSKIQHPNIISILGCSSQGEARFIVYELMQSGSLETQLHGMASINFCSLI